jgi:hypothetical protein
MPVPAEGWPHVFARIRDAAVQMKGAGLEVDAQMVTKSEEVLCYDCAWLSLTALSTVTCNLWL